MWTPAIAAEMAALGRYVPVKELNLRKEAEFYGYTRYSTSLYADLADHRYVKSGTGRKAWGCRGISNRVRDGV